MNRPNLSIMDIYPEMLQDAYGLCEAILTEDYGYTENDFFKAFYEELKASELDNLSNRLTYIIFRIAEDLIKRKDPKALVDYNINGTDDTQFYINGEQQ